MKFAWDHSVINIAAWDSSEIEQVDVEEYKVLLVHNAEQAGHELNADELIIEYF